MKTFLAKISLPKKIGLFLLALITFFLIFQFSIDYFITHFLSDDLKEYGALLSNGLTITAKLTLTSSILGGLLGLILSILYQQNKWSKALVMTWVELWRGTPLLVQILFAYYALPELLPENFTISEFEAATLALGFNFSAYTSEVFRAGINSIPEGQWEASYCLGLTKFKTYRFIIFPQTIRLTLPPMLNNFIGLIKDTSLASSIGLLELSLAAQRISSQTFKPVESLSTIAILYLFLTFFVSFLSQLFDFEKESSC